MTLYFISGLGATYQVFKRLRFPNTITVRYVDWVEPLKNENLKAYCSRLAIQFDTSQNFVIIGLSFGGVIATELTKQLKPKETIIISSVSTKKEIPWTYKTLGVLGLNKLIPAKLLKKPTALTYWFFGVTNNDEKQLLQEMLLNTSPKFLKWAIDQILHWTNNERPQNLFHIHGRADRILPCNNTKADIKIKDGGHLMIYSHADKINALLIERLGYS